MDAVSSDSPFVLMYSVNLDRVLHGKALQHSARSACITHSEPFCMTHSFMLVINDAYRLVFTQGFLNAITLQIDATID